VRNFGLIKNLPEGCCVEVPVLASKYGLEPIAVGELPPQLALLTNISARCEELAVEGAYEGDKRKIFHAICFDPLTSAVLSLEEIKKMTDEMFEANREYLTYFGDC
jgi:alpha-galactosidase